MWSKENNLNPNLYDVEDEQISEVTFKEIA